MKLEGKVCVVTGGGQGLGEAICLAMADEGAHVVVADLNGASARRVQDQILSKGRRALALEVDVSSAAQVRTMVDETLRAFSAIHVLVNNAGVCRVGPIEKISEEEWDWVLRVNLKGTFLCSQAIIGVMKAQGYGKIINMGSVAGKVGGIAVGAHYSASKAGVICFTKSLARELAPFGIQVNAIAPGVIATAMTQEITGGDWQNYLQSIPLRRIGTPKDVARAAVFLASADADYITGEILDVNGGMLMD